MHPALTFVGLLGECLNCRVETRSAASGRNKLLLDSEVGFTLTPRRGLLLYYGRPCSDSTGTNVFGVSLPKQAVGEYFLASAFEKVLVQKTGYVGLTGSGGQKLFFRGFLDKYGIKPEVFAREVGTTSCTLRACPLASSTAPRWQSCPGSPRCTARLLSGH